MERYNIDRNWRFHLGDEPESREVDSDDSTWQVIDLPHDWSINLERHPGEPGGASGGFFPMGRGWYHKKIELASILPYHVPFSSLQERAGKKVWIEFEGVYMNSEVWLNEHFLGRHPYGYTGFRYDLTPYLKPGVANLLRVFVDNAHLPNSRWYSGSGIYRHVWLVAGNAVHITHEGTRIITPEVSPEEAHVSVSTQVENESDAAETVGIAWRIVDRNGTITSVTGSTMEIGPWESHTFSAMLAIVRPDFWSPENPTLYRLETEIHAQEELVDTASTTFGIRSLLFDPRRGFRLNGKTIKLKGGCVHHDNGVLGAASYDRAEVRKVELLKASGFNAVRCAHNPPAPAFLEACDRLGMLVIDEAFDCWRVGKNPGDYHVVFDDWWRRDLESMLLRDFNHPSIILWSIGNEIIERGRPEGVVLAQQLADFVRAIDPSRPVTCAVCGPWQHEWTWPQSRDFFAALDVGGYNYQRDQYLADHQEHPQRVMVGTESLPNEAFENWMSVLENDWVIGDFVWTALDYLGEAGIGRVYEGEGPEWGLGDFPWHQANCGDLDLCGCKRPQSYYRDVLWGNGEKLYIAVHHPVKEGQETKLTRWGWPEASARWTWPGYEGKMFSVDIYSACEQVELLLNGRSLGVQPSGKAEKMMAHFVVPYEPGRLEAVGYTAGRKIVESCIETCGEPQSIRLTPDRENIEHGDLSYVTVEVVDRQGRLCPQTEHPIEFTVEGSGRLLAVGSADPTNTESYSGTCHKVFQGRGLVVVKAGWETGQVTLYGRSEGLVDGQVSIAVRKKT